MSRHVEHDKQCTYSRGRSDASWQKRRVSCLSTWLQLTYKTRVDGPAETPIERVLLGHAGPQHTPNVRMQRSAVVTSPLSQASLARREPASLRRHAQHNSDHTGTPGDVVVEHNESYGDSSIIALMRRAYRVHDGEPAASTTSRRYVTIPGAARHVVQQATSIASPTWMDRASQLLDAYFATEPVSFPLLDREDIQARFRAITGSNIQHQPPMVLALYYLVLTMGSIMLGRSHTLDTDTFQSAWTNELYDKGYAILGSLGSTMNVMVVQCWFTLVSIFLGATTSN
jgi:hypothetical protein